MAITPSNWGRRVEITEVATTAISETGYVGLLTEANMPTEIWSLAENGGGDLRVCLNSDGTNQLPLEVVEFDTTGQTAVLWFRFPTFVSGESVWLFYDKVGETQPAVTDTFGRNAVWVDYLAVLHLNNSLIDSAGNGYDGVNDGATFTTVDNPFGIDWPSFDGSNDFISIPTGSALNNSFLTVQAIAKPDVLTIDDEGIISNRFSTQGNNYFQITARNDRTAFGLNDGAGENFFAAPAISDTSTSWLTLTSDATSLNSYVNGALSGSDTSIASDNQINTALDVRIGTYFDGSAVRTLDGKVGEVRLRLDTLSSDYIATEHENQNSPATFWSTGTPENTTGGGGLTIQPTAIASAESVPSPVVTNLLQVIEANSIPTAEAFNNPVLVVGATVLLPNDIPSEEAFGTAVIQNLLQEILPTGIASGEDFGTPTVLGGDSIVIPVTNRQTVQRIAEYLKGLGFTGNNNDIIMAWLRSEGYNDAYNDNFSLYLEEVEGLTGSFTDKFGNWRKQ